MNQAALFAPVTPATQSTVRLIHGDCLEVMSTLPASSVQMVFADLPYAQTAANWDALIDLERLWANIRAACTQNAQCVFSANMRLAASLLMSNPSAFRHDIVWNKKGRPSGYLQANKQPLRCHEHVLVFSLGARPTYKPQMAPGSPHKRHLSVSRQSGGECFAVKTQKVKPNKGTRHPQTILAINRVSGKQFHPTQKPVALLEWLIKTYTNEGDTVLDPTAGSGTTAIAALRTGRKAICIEKDKAYFEVMTKRVHEEQKQLRLGVGA